MISPPPPVAKALDAGATLAVSVSGGKDSQAMLNLLAEQRREQRWPGDFVAIHADLGRAEWPDTAAHVERTVEQAGARLIIVRRQDGADLVDRIEREVRRRAGNGLIWPSSSARYCTADMKRDPILRAQRALGPLVVAAVGLRAEESRARAGRPVLAVERRATARRLAELSPETALAEQQQGERLILNWLPFLDLEETDVWTACGTSAEDLAARRELHRAAAAEGCEKRMQAALDGWPAHRAYVLGSSRLSCALCVLAKRGDLDVGARHNGALLDAYIALEEATGQTFQPRLSLQKVRRDLDERLIA